MATVPDHARVSAVSIPADYLEMQRAAVRAVAALSRDAVNPLRAQLEEDFEGAFSVAERDLAQAVEKSESERREKLERLARRHAARLAQLEAVSAPALAALKKTVEREQVEAQAEYSDAMRQAARHRDEDALMVETVSEATMRGLSDELEAAKQELKSERRRLDRIHQQARAVLERHGCLPADEPSVAPAPDAADSVPVAIACDSEGRPLPAADPAKQLAALDALPPARLGGGAVFGLALLNLIPLAAASLGLRPGVDPRSFFVGGAIGFVATVFVTIFAVRTLRLRARTRLHTAALAGYAALREALAAALAAVDAQLGLAEQRFAEEATRVAAAQARDAEVIATEFKTRKSQAESRRTGLLQAAQAKLTRERDAIIHRDEKARLEAAEEERTRREEIETRYSGEVAQAKRNHAERLAVLTPRRDAARNDLESKWPVHLAALRRLVEQADRLAASPAFDWTNGLPPDWQPPRDRAGVLRIGSWRLELERLDPAAREMADFLSGRPAAIDVPVLLNLPTRGALLVQSGHGGRQDAIALLRATMLRLLTSLPPGRVRFTILDPIGLGESFAGFMHLADYAEALVGSRIWTETDQIDTRLGELTAHMETVIQKYLRNEFETIDDYNAQAGELAEPYRYLVIADFPAKFNEDSLRRLRSIMESGPRCGVYTLIAHDIDLPVSPDLHLEDLARSGLHVIRTERGFEYADAQLQACSLRMDEPPPDERLTKIMHAVGSAARDRLRVELPFETIIPTEQHLWTASAASEISVPLGHAGAVRSQSLRLGRGLAQHVLIAGKTGSGKSNLLHVLITNLALWYGPDEIELYLVDFKEGVEFKAYATHPIPHIRAIAIESDREFGISVLQRLDAELGRRGDLFRAAGVQDIAAYRALNLAPLPRTLLVVDEFQVFFTEDDRLSQEAAVLLDRLVRQGRAFGIHVLLGSQTLGGSTGLGRSTMGQMAVRIALQCSDADSQLILDDTNIAARLLSRAGEAIYNDAGGRIDGNNPFQVAWLPDDVRNRHLDRIGALARTRRIHREAPIVFEGSAPAHIEDNRPLAALLSPSAGFASDEKVVAMPRAWLGEAVAIKDPTAAEFKQQSGANLLIVSQRDDAAHALLGASLISLAAQLPAGRARFILLDPRASEPGDNDLSSLAAILPHPVDTVAFHDVPRRLSELAADLQDRLARTPDSRAPNSRDRAGSAGPDEIVFVFIVGLQRYRMLRKQEESFSFSRSSEETETTPDKHFAALLREGPVHGIHVIAWADTLATVERTLDRASLGEFDWRVLFQMSAADSSSLIDSPEANRLGLYRALLFSEEQGLLEKFRPYSSPDRGFLDAARTALARRSAQ